MSENHKLTISLSHMAVVIFLFLFLPGCLHLWSHSGKKGKEAALKEHQAPISGQCPRQVPFIESKDNWSGPTALAMVFGYYGYSVKPEEIAKSILSKEHKSINISDLALYARKHGFKPLICCGTLEGLKGAIENETPVIIMLKSIPIPLLEHEQYLVVFAFDDSKKVFRVHGEKPSEKLSYSKLLRRWKAEDCLMLIVIPDLR